MKTKCSCAFCESELVQDCLEPSFCQPCEIVFIKCPKCDASYNNRLSQCPECENKQV